jgi:hypothetical protein
MPRARKPSPAAAFELRVLPLDRLKPAPYNPRKVLAPDSPAYRKLRRSVAEFGLVEPLVWNERTGYVVGGHARLGILRDLGVKEVPVSVVRLSDARERALNVVLNNQEAQGRYDPALLHDLLADLGPGPEFELTGFEPDAIPALQFEPMPPADPLPEPDRVEVTLVMPAAVYGKAAARLDRLVREFDLVAHVRQS